MDKHEAREAGLGEGEGRGRAEEGKEEEFCPTKSQMLPGNVSIPMLNTSVL